MSDRKYVIRIRNADAEGEWRRIGEFRASLQGLTTVSDPLAADAAKALLSDGYYGPLDHDDWRWLYFKLASLVPEGESGIHYFFSKYAEEGA